MVVYGTEETGLEQLQNEVKVTQQVSKRAGVALGH